MKELVDVSIRFKNLRNSLKPPATQKALGVWQLVRGQSPFQSFSSPQAAYLCVNTSDPMVGVDLATAVKKNILKTYRMFGRPCPKRPRHGFVESRPVTSIDSLKELFIKALAVDSEAELLLMPKIEAIASAVFVPESGVLVIGDSNDGATAGRDTITLPVIKTQLPKQFRMDAGIAANAHVYAELVFDGNSSPYIVQARSGDPIAAGVTEFIPREVDVSTVLQPTEDLVAWEALTAALKDAVGVVCWQPGGSLASHPALHCLANGIPYLTRQTPPQIGETLRPESQAKKVFDPVQFLAGIRLTETGNRSHIDKALALAIGILHNAIQLEYSEHYSKLLGFSLGWIYRASAIACLGESRHYPGRGEDNKPSRGDVYRRALELCNEDITKRLGAFSYKFLHHKWHANFGGWLWYKALVQTMKLWNLITADRVSEAIGEANSLLNMAHNGGWLFNKFIPDNNVMNQAAARPAEFLAARTPQLLELLRNKNIVYMPLRHRKYRSSAKWKLEPAKIPGYKDRVQLRINGVETMSLITDLEFRQVMKDTFDNV